VEIKRLTLEHKEAFYEHAVRIQERNGKKGEVLHSPNVTAPNSERFQKDYIQNLSEDPAVWVIWGILSDGKILGHCDLQLSPRKEMQHRRMLGMAIEPVAQAKGFGRKLMKQAIDFCRENNIEYIDLCYFSHNIKAKNLYESFGFKTLGTLKDRFRVYGQVVDDTRMVLKLEV
jgi:RimJ/RimL family protein N-acetyltransferase